MRVNRDSRSSQRTSSWFSFTVGDWSLPVQTTWITMVRGGGAVGESLGFGCGNCAFSPYSGSIDTTSMNMMISVKSTSMSGVTLICGPRAPPPAIEKAIEFAPLEHARVCLIRHLASFQSSRPGHAHCKGAEKNSVLLPE